MATVHKLKVDPQYFTGLLSNDKPYEIRFNDRNYQKGDVLLLQEYCRVWNTYTGKHCMRIITHVLADFEGLAPGWVALGLAPVFGDLSKPMKPVPDGEYRLTGNWG